MVSLAQQDSSRVFKQTTAKSPLHFLMRERIARAQQLVCEPSCSLIEIGYTGASNFAQVFQGVVDVAPAEFRSAL